MSDFATRATLTLIEKVKAHLNHRYGLRLNSVNYFAILLSVGLTSVFVFNDTVVDTLVSVDKWARPLFLPSLWVVAIAVIFLIKAVKAPKSEIYPNPAYSGDEMEQAARSLGVTTSEEMVSYEAHNSDAARAVAMAQAVEVASRTSHDRESLRGRRYWLNKSLDAVGVSICLFVSALTIYAVVGLFV